MGTRVQGAGGTDGTFQTTRDLALPSAATQNNLIVAQIGSATDGLTLTSATLRNSDNTADSLVLTRSARNHAGAVTVPIASWWGIVPAGAGTVIRFATSSSVCHYHAIEISGLSTVAGLDDDQTTGAKDGGEVAYDQASASSSDSGAGITTTQPGMQIGHLQCDGAVTAITGTLGGSAANISSSTGRSALSNLTQAVTGTYDAQFSWTTAQVFSTINASYEDLAAAAATMPPGAGPLIGMTQHMQADPALAAW